MPGRTPGSLQDDAATEDKYRGDMKEGNKHGRGEMDYTNGDNYCGDWAGNERSGQGTLAQAPTTGETPGPIYNGEWGEDKKNGFGTETIDGNSYTGRWAMDAREAGPGRMVYANGDDYEGEWDANEQQNGFGSFYQSGKGVYHGQWSAGAKNGDGSYIFRNSEEYHGKWAVDKFEGTSFPSPLDSSLALQSRLALGSFAGTGSPPACPLFEHLRPWYIQVPQR